MILRGWLELNEKFKHHADEKDRFEEVMGIEYFNHDFLVQSKSSNISINIGGNQTTYLLDQFKDQIQFIIHGYNNHIRYGLHSLLLQIRLRSSRKTIKFLLKF